MVAQIEEKGPTTAGHNQW